MRFKRHTDRLLDGNGNPIELASYDNCQDGAAEIEVQIVGHPRITAEVRNQIEAFGHGVEVETDTHPDTDQPINIVTVPFRRPSQAPRGRRLHLAPARKGPSPALWALTFMAMILLVLFIINMFFTSPDARSKIFG